MTPHFHLIHERWIPIKRMNGSSDTVSLQEAFDQAPAIEGLSETAPPSLVAQYRLLLAILHRALSAMHPQGWTEKDRALWYKQGLPLQAIHTYFEQWSERFWLFHPTHPFLQVAELGVLPEIKDKRKPWALFSLPSASGNAPSVFDHSVDASPSEISAEEAARVLVGFLQFTPGGLVKAFHGSDKAGPLANTAAVVALGESLAQTLVLNLHPSLSREAVADLPAWEKAPLKKSDLMAKPEFATGPNDRYSRQSRAVLLEEIPGGQVRWIRFAEGRAMEETPSAPDPMASFRAGNDKLIRLTFGEGRSVWRDLPALMPSGTGHTQAAAVLQWALSLREKLGDDDGYQRFLVAGVASDQAKVLRWRSEQLRLPLHLLENPDAIRVLRELISQAEELHYALKKLLVGMLLETLPSPEHGDTRKRARAMFENGSCSMAYFSFLEKSFARLPEVCQVPEKAESYWATSLRGAAREMWACALRELGSQPKSLRAAARFSSRYFGVLNKQLPTLPESP